MSDAVEKFREQQYKVLVGLGHPERVEGLMRIAAVFARRQRGRIVAVSVIVAPEGITPAQAAEHVDTELLESAEAMVQRAQDFGAELGIAVEPVIEFATDIATGIAAAGERYDADMILLGFSPPAAADAEAAEVPARLTERVAGMTGRSLAVVDLPEGDQPARLLIPVTETLEPTVVRDLVKIVSLFGGAEITFLGLLPRGLSAEEFAQRAELLREKIEGVECEDVQSLDLDAREVSHCLFGAEAQQMAGESHEAAFILRAVV